MGFGKGLAAAALVGGMALSGCVDPHKSVRAALTEETAALTAALVEAYSGAREVPQNLYDLPMEVWPAGLERRPVGEVTTLADIRALHAPYLFVSGPLEGLRMSYEITPGGYLALSVPTGRTSFCSWYA